jgi:transcription termination factor Rho
MVEALLAAQMPVAEKIRRADHVVWNEGPPAILRGQARRLLSALIPCMSATPADPDPAPTEPGTPAAPLPPALAATPGPAPAVPLVTSLASDASDASDGSDGSASAVPGAAPEAAVPAVELPPPVVIDVGEFRQKSLAELHAMAATIPQRLLQQNPSKSQLVFDLLSFFAREGAHLIGEGVVEQAKENYAMLRDPKRSFRTSPDDFYLNGHLVRDLGLRVGQKLRVKLRGPRERDKYLSVTEVLEVEGIPVADYRAPKDFDKLTPLFPDRRLILEGEGEAALSVRVIDLIAPLGLGQRALIVAPPRGGKTIILKQVARAIRRNHPEVELVILLLDERPEEVTDFEETVGAEVFASTFDEPAKRHAQVADLVVERAKRLVELGKDVVLLLDSLTRLARGHNSAMQGNGPVGSGGINPVALQKSRKFFGTARNVEEGGSLTILATALIETESRMDDVIFEEFKGTGNMEIRLDRELAERRVFPAIHIPQSGTRNDDRLYHKEEMPRVLDIRRQLAQLPIGDAIETLMKNLRATQNNAELLLRGLR